MRRLVEERPAAVLLSGDFIYKPGEDAAEEIEAAVEMLRPLKGAGIPTFAVLGNHDFAKKSRDEAKRIQIAQQVRAALEAAGVEPGGCPAPSNRSGTGSCAVHRRYRI